MVEAAAVAAQARPPALQGGRAEPPEGQRGPEGLAVQARARALERLGRPPRSRGPPGRCHPLLGQRSHRLTSRRSPARARAGRPVDHLKRSHSRWSATTRRPYRPGLPAEALLLRRAVGWRASQAPQRPPSLASASDQTWLTTRTSSGLHLVPPLGPRGAARSLCWQRALPESANRGVLRGGCVPSSVTAVPQSSVEASEQAWLTTRTVAGLHPAPPLRPRGVARSLRWPQALPESANRWVLPGGCVPSSKPAVPQSCRRPRTVHSACGALSG